MICLLPSLLNGCCEAPPEDEDDGTGVMLMDVDVVRDCVVCPGVVFVTVIAT